MARKRMIDPTIWADEDFGKMSFEAQIMFVGIVSNADDEGRLPGNALFLSSTIFPYKAISQQKAVDIRNEILSNMKSVILYKINNKEFIELQKFKQYQVINKPSESKYPPLPEDYGSTTVVLPPNRIEENRIEEKRRDTPPKNYSYKGIEYLRNIPKEDLKEFSTKFVISYSEIIKKAQQLVNYCQMHGKIYKDYKAFLRNSIQGDFKERREKGKDLSDLIPD